MFNEFMSVAALLVTIIGGLFSWAYKAPMSFQKYSQITSLIISSACALLVLYIVGYNDGVSDLTLKQENYISTSQHKYSIMLVVYLAIAGSISQYLFKLIGIIASSIREEVSTRRENKA